jgi:bacteriocin biosynthesis cyclodehydratase domain-containing protein
MTVEIRPQSEKLHRLRVQVIDTESGVILKRGSAEMKIDGARAAEVVQTIFVMTGEDGATADEICALFAAPARPAVRQLIEGLVARRFLARADDMHAPSDGVESNLDILYWHFGAQTELVNRRLNKQPITIMGVNSISRQLAAALVAGGLEAVEVVDDPLLCNLRLFDANHDLSAEQWPAALQPPRAYDEWMHELDASSLGCIVATSDFGGLHLMRRWNEFSVEHGCHFLPVVLQDMIGYVGPLVVPGETPCFECLRARQNSHMEDPDSQRAAEHAAFEGQVVAGFHPSMASILGDIAAIELSKFYGGWLQQRVVGSLIEVNLLDSRMTPHKVLKVPRCRVCSPLNAHAPVNLNKAVFYPLNEE